MTTDTDGPITKQVPVPMDVPRDPGAYRATVHFGQRLRERVPEDKRDRVVRDTIEHGDHHDSSRPKEAEAHDRVARHMKAVYGGWVIVLGICPDAYRHEDRKHLAVTIYEEGEQA